MKVFDLVHQVTHVFILGVLFSFIPSNQSTLHPHSFEVEKFSKLSIINPVFELYTGFTVSAHQTNTHLKV